MFRVISIHVGDCWANLLKPYGFINKRQMVNEMGLWVTLKTLGFNEWKLQKSHIGEMWFQRGVYICSDI